MSKQSSPRGADSPSRRGSLKLQSSYGPNGTKALDISPPRSGQRLSFADEHGQTLEKITYSARLHYSGWDGAGEPGENKGGCCVIS